ncbi:MAG: hypothetical protein QOF74_2410, partial [Caballeronia mineralivorans]|nr:hypothetical protein [Caballeronia mineralivorans]
MNSNHSDASRAPADSLSFSGDNANPPAPPFAELTPERVLDALDSVLMPLGERTDGGMLALNSYENRVYQVGMEDGPPMVAKFY